MTSGRAADRLVKVLCALVAALALIVLIGGWLLGSERLRVLNSAWSAMAPLTAVLLLLVSAGSSQFRARRRISFVLLGLAALLAAAVLVEYFADVSLGLQALSNLFQRNATTPIPELPAPDAAASFILIALALACLQSRNSHFHDFADVVAALIGIVCFQVLISYVYSLAHFANGAGFRQIAPHSTAAVMLLAVTVAAQRPTRGVFAAMVGPAMSAVLLRRLLLVSLLSSLLIGLLFVQAMRVGLGGSLPDIVAWSVTAMIVVLVVMLFVTSGEMRRGEAMVREHEDELLEASALAEEASQTKSRFMAVMSHELRTPLTAILGYTDLLEAGIAGKISTDAQHFVERIRSSGWHLAGLIDAVLLYASGQPLGRHVPSERVELIPLIRSVMETFDAHAHQKEIALRLDAIDETVIVQTGPSRLREILMNLIGNAVKFTERGSVTVRVRAAAAGTVVVIADTGIGMAAEDVERLWQPFEQIAEPHTRVHGGLGLGLALTRMLADQLGARLEVTSHPGVGTTVTLVLPRGQAEPRTEEPRLDGQHILIVDDEPAVRRIMARSLTRYGARTTEAGSAQEALQCIDQDGHADAIVTDISMPDMSGIELARVLNARGSAPPLLFVTGAELTDEERSEIRAFGNRLLNKPFEMQELARTVVRAIEA